MSPIWVCSSSLVNQSESLAHDQVALEVTSTSLALFSSELYSTALALRLNSSAPPLSWVTVKVASVPSAVSKVMVPTRVAPVVFSVMA